MRFLVMVSAASAIMAAVTVLGAGYIQGEFDTPTEGIEWLRSIVAQVVA